MKKVLVVDGNSVLFRAYYGVHGHLTKSDGTPTMQRIFSAGLTAFIALFIISSKVL